MNFPLHKIRIKNVYAVNDINYSTQKTIFRNDRTLYSFAFKFSGETVYVCEGKKYVSDNTHLLLIPKEKSYYFKTLEVGQCIMIEFDSDVEIGEFYSYKINDSTEIGRLFTHLNHLWTIKADGYELASLSTIYEILYKIHISDNMGYAALKRKKILQPAIAYIQDHYAETDITNDKLAALTGISTVYFRRLFNEAYRVSPMKYIHNIRIDKAKKLLLSDYHSISFIAESVGFSSVYSFSRAFKNATGVSPSEYIKKM